MKRSIPILAVTMLFALPSFVIAQPPGGGPRGGRGGGGFGDGGSPIEMISQIFDRADSNGDGQLSKQELTTAMASQTRGGQRGGNQQGRGGPPPGQARGPEQRGPEQRGPEQRGSGRGRLQQHAPGAGEHGPGEHRPGEHRPGEHGPSGPPPRPGQILPDFIVQTLDLNERQQRLLTALQTEVDKQMAAILTDEQQTQLENHRPQGGPGGDRERRRPGGPDRRGAEAQQRPESDRPKRPR